MKLVAVCAAALCAVGLASPAAAPQPRAAVTPVPSLTPAATEKLWRKLVSRPQGRFYDATECRPFRAVFYGATDWRRLATKLAASGSPCAEYFISVPPLVSDKTQPRGDEAWRIRALGPNFHALSEVHMGAWAQWVTANSSTWFQAGVEARRRMGLMGYDVSLGDTWAVNELSSAVRRGDGNARVNVREFVRGLYAGDGTTARGVVWITGMSQPTMELSVYQARLQDWYEDNPFWTDMGKYVSDWSQELYGDVRNYAVPSASIAARGDSLNDYLRHELTLARVAPTSASTAASFLEATYSPLANAAWKFDQAFGWTAVPYDLMEHYVSAQVYALRVAERGGFAWSPKNLDALPAADFAAQTDAILDRLAGAIRDSAQPNALDPGVGACADLWCAGDLEGAWFNDRWTTFQAWKPSELVFSTAPQALIAGSHAALAVDLRTSSGVSLTVTSPLTVSLSSSSSGGSFSSSATGPWTSTLALTIPTGSVSAGFYYRDTRAGEATLTAAASGKSSALQSQTVSAAPLARIALTPPSATLAPGESQAFAAHGTDAYGNDVPPAELVWSVGSGTPGTVSADGVFTAGSETGNGSVVATDGGVTVSAAITVPVRVASVVYTPSYRDLGARISLVDAAGSPRAGIAVTGAILRNGVQYATFSGWTGADGTLTRTIRKAPSGCYTTSVRSLSAQGWDGTTPANRFCN
jgi:hypothetical protein